jgi:glucose-6-phosphate-specific signal transduction histidine kinase
MQSSSSKPAKPQRVLKDLLIVALLVIGFLMFAMKVDLAERVLAWTGRFEFLQADEWPLTLVVLALALAWFSYRRWREQSLEVKARLAAEGQVHHTLAQNRRLAQQLITAQEQERRHLARELHDEIGQCCVAIRVNASSIARDTEKTMPIAHASATSIAQTSDHLHEVVRGMLERMRPTGLDDLGLSASLEVLTSTWAARHGVACAYQAEGPVEGLDEASNIAIYRAVQEALTNVVKHAKARHVRVSFTSDASGINPDIKLRIDDDGAGMLLSDSNRGLGLVGMRERIDALGGQLSLQPSPLGGLRVEIVLPASHHTLASAG